MTDTLKAYDLVYMCQRYWQVLAAFAVTALIAASFISVSSPMVYRAEATLSVPLRDLGFTQSAPFIAGALQEDVASPEVVSFMAHIERHRVDQYKTRLVAERDGSDPIDAIAMLVRAIEARHAGGALATSRELALGRLARASEETERLAIQSELAAIPAGLIVSQPSTQAYRRINLVGALAAGFIVSVFGFVAVVGAVEIAMAVLRDRR